MLAFCRDFLPSTMPCEVMSPSANTLFKINIMHVVVNCLVYH